MFQNGIEGQFYYKTFFHCFLLSFLAGSVNAGGFLACGRYVTHVTGFATLSGIDMANGDFKAAFGVLSVPLYFLIGSMISGFLIDRPLHQGRHPHYALVMGLIAGCLVVVMLAGYFHFFGIFGQTANLRQDYILLALLCGASGLQNAAITTFSGAVVRTTHLTGITTDLGVGLIRAFFSKAKHQPYYREVRSNWLRVITIVAFILGSWIGAVLFIKFMYLAFLLPMCIAFYAMLVTLKGSKSQTGFLRENL